MRDEDQRSGRSESLQVEKGQPREEPAGLAEQEAELPLGPMREAIVGLRDADQEEETVQADRAEAERRKDNAPE